MELLLVNNIYAKYSTETENKTLVNMNVILDYNLKTLCPGERGIFTLIVVLLLIFAVIGNIATLIVNVKKKIIRPLFRACVLSLACSDLVTAILTGITYLAQLSTEFIQIWHLGEIMCSLIPFLTTAAIIVNGLTLVGIVVDRYMALMRGVKIAWEPGTIFSSTCIIVVWGLAAGVASPMISSYTTYDTYIVLTNSNNRTVANGFLPVKMCASDKNDNAYYYAIVFGIVFLPSLVVFLWLNGVIAQEIWIRRRALSTRCTNPSNRKGISALPQKNQNISTNPCKTLRKQRTTRETRQLRMLCVIFLLMLVFLFCRLPTWIYLIMKLYGNYREKVHWVLHFSFGAISLTSCVVNPLLYTFLMGTIRYTLMIKDRIRECCSFPSIWCTGASSATDIKYITERSNGEIYTIFEEK